MKRFFRFVPTGVTSLIVVLVIAYLSLSSDPLGASHVHLFPGSDKVAHFLMYAVASMAFIIDYAKFRLPHHTRLNVEMAVTACAMLLGLLMEVSQLALSQSRHYDNYDILFNCLGALAGFLFMRFGGGMHRFRRMMLSHRHHHHRHG